MVLKLAGRLLASTICYKHPAIEIVSLSTQQYWVCFKSEKDNAAKPKKLTLLFICCVQDTVWKEKSVCYRDW